MMMWREYVAISDVRMRRQQIVVILFFSLFTLGNRLSVLQVSLLQFQCVHNKVPKWSFGLYKIIVRQERQHRVLLSSNSLSDPSIWTKGVIEAGLGCWIFKSGCSNLDRRSVSQGELCRHGSTGQCARQSVGKTDSVLFPTLGTGKKAKKGVGSRCKQPQKLPSQPRSEASKTLESAAQQDSD